MSIGTRDGPLWPTEIPIPFVSPKQPVESGIPVADAGGVMSTHRPLLNSFFSSLHPWA